MYDYMLLKQRMKEMRIRQYDIAKAIKKSRATISKIFNGERDFMQSEILIISNLLKIKEKDIWEYFFTKKLKKT